MAGAGLTVAPSGLGLTRAESILSSTYSSTVQRAAAPADTGTHPGTAGTVASHRRAAVTISTFETVSQLVQSSPSICERGHPLRKAEVAYPA